MPTLVVRTSGTPKIRLEVLSARGVNMILFLSYASVAIAFVISVLEHSSKAYVESRLDAFTCTDPGQEAAAGCVSPNFTAPIPPPGPDGHVAPRLVNASRFEYTTSSHEHLTSFLKIQTSLHRPRDTPFDRDYAILVDIVGNVSARLAVSGSRARPRGTDADTWVHVDEVATITTLRCAAHATDCAPLLLYERENLAYSEYRLNLTFNNSNLLHWAHGHNSTLQFVVSSNTPAYNLQKLVLRSTVLALALGMLVWYVCSFRGRKWSEWLPEQRWILLSLAGLLGFQDPSLLPRFFLFGPVEHIVFISSVFLHTGGVTCLYVFWLLMLDGIRPKNKRTRSFYGWKVGFGLLCMGSCVLAYVYGGAGIGWIEATGAIPHADLGYGKSELAGLRLLWLVFSGFTLVWFIWFLMLFCKTRRQLRPLPYLEHRFRQLSFNFFISQAWLVVLYLVCEFIWSFTPLHTTYTDDYDYEPDARIVLVTLYLCLVAYVYMPPPPQKQEALPRTRNRRQSTAAGKRAPPMFYPEVAAVLLEFANEAYADPAEHERGEGITCADTNGDGVASGRRRMVAGGDAYTVSWLRNEGFDTTCCIALEDHVPRVPGAVAASRRWRRRRVIVAFRGTASAAHVRTNLSFTPSRIALRCGQFGDAHAAVAERIQRAKLRAHNGFVQAYSCLAEQIAQQLHEMLTSAAVDGEPLHFMFTGHSLGGSLATIAALETRLWSKNWAPAPYTMPGSVGQASAKPPIVSMCSFGSPCTGNGAFARCYDLEVPDSYRVVCDRDVVSNVCHGWMYTHVGREVIIDAHGNCLVEPSKVEGVFREQRRSLKDHRIASYRDALASLVERYGPAAQTPLPRAAGSVQEAAPEPERAGAALALPPCHLPWGTPKNVASRLPREDLRAPLLAFTAHTPPTSPLRGSPRNSIQEQSSSELATPRDTWARISEALGAPTTPPRVARE